MACAYTSRAYIYRCRGRLSLLAEDLSDELVQGLIALVCTSTGRFVLSKLSNILKRGAKAFDPAAVDHATVTRVAIATRAEIDRNTVRRKLAEIEAKRVIKQKPPKRGPPLGTRPSETLFSW